MPVNIESEVVAVPLCNNLEKLKVVDETKTHAVNFYFQNVCGVSNKKEELELYIETRSELFDYICFAEHFLNNVSCPLFQISNYRTAAYSARKNKIRGGSLIMQSLTKECKDLAFCKKINKVESFEISGIRDLSYYLNIICVYRNPDAKNFGDFMYRLEQLLQLTYNNKTLIFGDFNINLLKENRMMEEFLVLIKCYNFRTLINNEYTFKILFYLESENFKRNDSSSCIDNIITNINDDGISYVEVDHNGIGDGHAGLLCGVIVDKARQSDMYVIKERRAWTARNMALFRDLILRENWLGLGVNDFLKRFQEIFKACFKKRKKKLNLRKAAESSVWVTKGLRVSSKMKRFLTSANKFCDKSVCYYKNNYIRIFRRVVKTAKRL